MSVRSSRSVALLLALSSLAGCGGGSKVGGATFACIGTEPTAICLENCNLGCQDNGCSRTDIAQNEIVIFQFSEDILPASVTPSSIRFRTAGGEPPIGEFLVNGKIVEFVPTLAISGGETFFGFNAGETYTLTIPGGEEQTSVVRSTSGKPFAKTMVCVLTSSLGIVDLNGVPPSATLVSPTPAQVNSAPRDVDIVLEFNELIDATPFLSGTQSPVTFNVRRNRPTPAGGFECDPASQPQVLNGSQFLDFDPVRGVSVLTFRPTAILPGNICVQIDVTSGVQDLSGKPAQPQSFSFRTVVVPLVEQEILEDFVDDTFLDVDASAGRWTGGTASFWRIGGDGRHGAFSLSMCEPSEPPVFVNGRRVYKLNLDQTTIPAGNTYGPTAVAVTDGRFYFTSMVVPADARIEFSGVGNVPAMFTVAGRLDIAGDIDASGLGHTAMPPATGPGSTVGQPGREGGPFGGRGGDGGDKISQLQATTTGANALHQGDNGGSARLFGGHAYAATAAASGGRGSNVFPASGLNADLYFAVTNPITLPAYCVSACAGGGGGGFVLAGADGRVVSNNHGTPPPLTSQMGPNALGGTAVQILPFPAGSGLITRASEHFLIGGSGGGGAASQACLALRALLDRWSVGSGGGGGGGAVALRAGNSLRLAPTARVWAKGGSSPGSTLPGAANGQPAPAGGGSGGSIVLQAGNQDGIEIAGAIDVRGGTGGVFDRGAGTAPLFLPPGAKVRIDGGNGSHGFVRLETPTQPDLSLLNTMQPTAVPDNLGVLTEVDDLVGMRSKFRSTGEIFGPEYARYEIYATVNGNPVVFSDDPAVSPVQAGIGSPLRAKFQCAQLDLVTGDVLQLGPWRDGVATTATQTGIASEGLNGYRFALFADYTLATTIVIDSIVIVYRV